MNPLQKNCPPLSKAFLKLVSTIATSSDNPIDILASFEDRSKENKAYRHSLHEKLVPATKGLGHCIDDRQHRSTKDGMSPSGIPGGGVGVQSLFMLLGQDFKEARFSTRSLYKGMKWGKIAVHTDEDNRHKLGGCGFADNLPAIADLVQNQFPSSIINPTPEIFEQGIGAKAIARLKRFNCSHEVVLKGPHCPEASLVINFNKDRTLERCSLPGREGIFVWDAHVICEERVVDEMNKLTGKSISPEEWTRLLTVTTLATFAVLKTLANKPVNLPIILMDQ